MTCAGCLEEHGELDTLRVSGDTRNGHSHQLKAEPIILLVIP